MPPQPPAAGPPRVPPSGPAPLASGDPAYRRLLIGLFLAGVATFAQLYSPQGLLPLVAAVAGAVVLGQMLTVVEVAGIAAVVAAVAVRKPGESAAADPADGGKVMTGTERRANGG